MDWYRIKKIILIEENKGYLQIRMDGTNGN